MANNVKMEIEVPSEMYDDIRSSRIPYMILQDTDQPLAEKDIVVITCPRSARRMRACVTCADNSTTSQAIRPGYTVIGVMSVYDAENLGIIDLGDDD